MTPKKPTPADAPDDTVEPAAETVELPDLGYGDYVRYRLEDGTETHGMVIEALEGDEDRDDALLVVELPAPVTIAADQLVSDAGDED